ncbi:dimethylamine monooxygenase subunit DmmA family protein [Neptuniibacter sp. 2_MG-2023]|jgi:hypothetical protein|uniref:dimethylamine monooxygenase subunit DmmA family protein n=1 Tax=Neptuniibacter sp. 2_MG-2023 TaxID=3062671 RepID=UPI0026E3AA4C|nr:dimethylamine monooxygenase subunit DmmA family protein [Neptuniibacter sp. 2_MG-2023]MDO6513544.1 dimethylamine monooxygenase subunit DmmA family protein [Neptuniibacter sp. 2_MG-2023]
MEPESVSVVTSKPIYRSEISDAPCAYSLFICEQLSTAFSDLYQSKTVAKKDLVDDGDLESVKDQLVTLLADAPAATLVYLSGTEKYMWLVGEQLKALGVTEDQMVMLPPLNTERSVFCCHCYTVTDHVVTAPATCAGCGKLLAVTDHFAKSHAAYFGYQVNAENATEIPESVELS